MYKLNCRTFTAISEEKKNNITLSSTRPNENGTPEKYKEITSLNYLIQWAKYTEVSI